ncbi:MAG: HAD family hydrolase [Caldilineaceae bacterium]|nr:HAD family hydrolase [Caldilineaceae bacterium]
MAELRFGDDVFDAGLVIFDKDGTLIDFAALWAHYTIGAVEALMTATIEAPVAIAQNEVPNKDQLRADLYAMLGYDPTARRFDPQSPVVTAPLPTIYTLAAGVLYRHGWGWLDAELQVERAFAPVMNAPLTRELVRPTAALPALFEALTAAGVQIAVITSDDRAPTLTALEWLGVLDPVAFIACADDPYPYKPAPESIWAACETTGVDLAHTVMVGDSTTDMLMGQRAGVGLCVAVLTGMMDAAVLAPHADVVLQSVGEIQVPG